jgi:putative hemolysin
MDALIPLNELKRRLDISTFEGEESEGFQTLNGFLTWLIGRVPEVGEVIEYQEWQFEVLKVQNNRILQVRVVRITG